MNVFERPVLFNGKHVKSLKVTFTFISLVILFTVSTVALVANAQEASSTNATVPEQTTTSEERREVIETIIEEKKEAIREREAVIQETMVERRSSLTERAQTRITNLAANISNRMDAVVVRLLQISDRLQDRINLIAEQSIDVNDAQVSLDTAVGMLNTLQTNLAEIDTKVMSVVGSESPKDAWVTLRATYQNFKKDIVAAHAELRNTVALLKAAMADEGGVSSTVQENIDQSTTTSSSTTAE